MVQTLSNGAYDLVVAGGGSAGTATAIRAAEAGLSVLLLEKTHNLGGTCRYSAGNLLEFLNGRAADHLAALSLGATPADVLSAYADGIAGLRSWLHSIGARTEDVRGLPRCWPNSPAGAEVRYYRVTGHPDGGPALWLALEAALLAHQVDIRVDSRVTSLLVEDGAVVGAHIETPDGPATVRAGSGVVLATGGFEANASLLETYLPLSPMEPVGHLANTGDAVDIAQSVGAAMWHMSTYFGFWTHRAPRQSVAYPLILAQGSFFIVDGEGRRFAAESGREAHDVLHRFGDYLPADKLSSRLPAFAVFDRAFIEHSPLAPFPTANAHRWSPDNHAEVADGWIRSATGIRELAQLIAVDPDVLQSTLESFNHAAKSGLDTDFQRPAESMSALDGPELYALEIRPGVATTSGGPRRDDQARVLDRTGEAIPGLFAVGNAGSVWGRLTEHGGGLTDGLVFADIAARTAATSTQLVP